MAVVLVDYSALGRLIRSGIDYINSLPMPLPSIIWLAFSILCLSTIWRITKRCLGFKE